MLRATPAAAVLNRSSTVWTDDLGKRFRVEGSYYMGLNYYLYYFGVPCYTYSIMGPKTPF